MAELLEEYRNKLFLYNKLEDFLPPHDLNDEDIRKLMESTGRIKQGEKVYEPFAEYLRQQELLGMDQVMRHQGFTQCFCDQ